MSENEISGTYLSGILTQSLPENVPLSGDMLVLSEPVLRHRLNPVEYRSKRMSFSVLSAKLVEDVGKFLELGSMAREESSDYAVAGHDHDSVYNRFSISCALSAGPDTVKVAEFRVDGNRYDMYAPKPRPRRPLQPSIGQLKFVYGTSPRQIDAYSESFDGWVYADGSRYSLSDFEVGDAFDAVGGEFQVPVLNWFVKANPAPYERNDLGERYAHVDPPHSHGVELRLAGIVSANLSYADTGAPGASSGSYGSDVKDGEQSYELPLDYSGLEIATPNHIRPYAGTGGETYPTYNSVPTMIYIGKPRGLRRKEAQG